MPNFESFLSRHSEFAVQAIIERLERYQGIPIQVCVPLEERWNLVMGQVPCQVTKLAA